MRVTNFYDTPNGNNTFERRVSVHYFLGRKLWYTVSERRKGEDWVVAERRWIGLFGLAIL